MDHVKGALVDCRASGCPVEEAMKIKKSLWICLAFQVFALLFATFAFSYFDSPKVAGQFTGPLFLASGALPIYFMLMGVWPVKNISVICSLVMTFVFSVPMLLLRYIYMGQDFSELTFLGVPSAHFHRFSGIMFCVLMASEIYQLYRLRK